MDEEDHIDFVAVLIWIESLDPDMVRAAEHRFGFDLDAILAERRRRSIEHNRIIEEAGKALMILDTKGSA